MGGRRSKRQANNGEEEDEATKKKQIPTERKQIRYTAPPHAPPEPRKAKEEDDRLPESQLRRWCGAASD